MLFDVTHQPQRVHTRSDYWTFCGQLRKQQAVTEMRLCGDYASTSRVQKVSRKKIESSNRWTFSGRLVDLFMEKSTYGPTAGHFMDSATFVHKSSRKGVLERLVYSEEMQARHAKRVTRMEHGDFRCRETVLRYGLREGRGRSSRRFVFGETWRSARFTRR